MPALHMGALKMAVAAPNKYAERSILSIAVVYSISNCYVWSLQQCLKVTLGRNYLRSHTKSYKSYKIASVAHKASLLKYLCLLMSLKLLLTLS